MRVTLSLSAMDKRRLDEVCAGRGGASYASVVRVAVEHLRLVEEGRVYVERPGQAARQVVMP